MGKEKSNLAPLSGHPFITDGGIETTLIYREGFELPSFASFVLLKDDKGRQALEKYFSAYIDLAQKYGVGLILETATWRANPDWAAKLGYSPSALAAANQQAVKLLIDQRSKQSESKHPLMISGCIGPRGDGYKADARMSAEDAETYHEVQIKSLASAGADLISAITMTYPEEAIGIVWAAQSAGMPVVISFTVETNGRLPSGHTLQEAIQEVDEATDNAVAYYMINCAHPTHLEPAVNPSEPWARRVHGIRVNASKQSHAELDQATELDAGNPEELGGQCATLQARWPELNVLGGCCGTDERHIEEICKASVANKQLIRG